MQRTGHIEKTKKRPLRKAAIAARQRMNQLLKDNALTVLFTPT